MTSRERVLSVFEHDLPDRVPCWCGSSVEFWEKAKKELGLDDEGLRLRFKDDFRRVFAEYAGPEFALEHPKAICRTPFGIEREGYGYGQPLSHPLADATLEDVEDYTWPDPAWMDVSKIKQAAQAYNGQFAILGGEWSPFWHDAIDLVGMENLYIKMYSEPEVVDAILKHIVDYYFEVSKRTFDAASDAIDIFFMGNDFGSQTGPLMSPDMFDRFMAPHLARLCDLGHSYGLKTQLHCCGGVYELIPSMIEAGLDGYHAVQTSCRGMDLHKLKSEFGDKIVFNGAIDSHHTLIEKDTQGVIEDTRKVLDTMMPGSAYIAGASHDTILEETPVENVLAMFDAVVEYGRY
ncbi:methylcobalamin:coenzyme M methyltransferase [Anaerohalosphaera lusitana]|uniref:Methylcobalamin:coenzyme M methyltransferase n=1 Tax=Anaerohalosphaera lusitana TaxID=1936003 RepID=A0A1U9NQH0_9BACT|nr:uroporphyrinogen decarboxylase family protein [Anaerohalosphaera lusitana]AQT70027.1 methylcobalamin:coenzyme M methyltransferase [Anaerohalosphaera lusitana]